jgi:hypothetical protein
MEMDKNKTETDNGHEGEGAIALSEILTIKGKEEKQQPKTKQRSRSLAAKEKQRWADIGGKEIYNKGGVYQLHFDATSLFNSVLDGEQLNSNDSVFIVTRVNTLFDSKSDVGRVCIRMGKAVFHPSDDFSVKYSEFPLIERFLRNATRTIAKHSANKYLPLFAKRVIVKLINGRYANIKPKPDMAKNKLFTFSEFLLVIRNNSQVFQLGYSICDVEDSPAVIRRKGAKACLDILCREGVVKKIEKDDLPIAISAKVLDVYQLIN